MTKSPQPERHAQSELADAAKPGRSLSKRLRRIAAVLLAIYGIVCVGMMALESRLVFPGAYFDTSPFMDPARFTPESPALGEVVGFDYPAIDGESITGRILVAESPKRVVLFLHGNGIRAAQMDDWTRRLSTAMDATVLTAEFRGFFGQGFTPTEITVTDDAIAALAALAQATKTPPSEIVIYGRSLGGGIAAGLVQSMIEANDPPKQIILDRTFDSVRSVAASQFWFLPVNVLLRNRFDSVGKLEGYSGRVIQIHGSPDRIVPMRFGRALYESLDSQDKHWIEVDGMKHNDRLPGSVLNRAADLLLPATSIRNAEENVDA